MVDDSMSRIREDALACTKCPAYKYRENVVIYRGMVDPKLVFVGQSPGVTEDRIGVPFVGPSGRMLETEMVTRRFPPWGVINVVNCRPPGDKWKDDYGIACTTFLERKLAVLSPRWVVALGGDAYKFVLPISRPKASDPSPPFKLFRIIHPAAVLRHPSWKQKWDDGWDRLETELKMEAKDGEQGVEA